MVALHSKHENLYSTALPAKPISPKLSVLKLQTFITSHRSWGLGIQEWLIWAVVTQDYLMILQSRYCRIQSRSPGTILEAGHDAVKINIYLHMLVSFVNIHSLHVRFFISTTLGSLITLDFSPCLIAHSWSVSTSC